MRGEVRLAELATVSLAIASPMLRMALPGIRELTWRMAIRMLASRGLRNLLALAGERAAPMQASRRSPSIAAGSMHTEEM